MQVKRELQKVPVPSTQFAIEGYWDESRIPRAIRFGYKIDGQVYVAGIAFEDVTAMRHRAERACTIWHIEGCYDTLAQVDGSTWADEIRADMTERWRAQFKCNHYMIYLDSVGCFEVVANGWRMLEATPAEPASPQAW